MRYKRAKETEPLTWWKIISGIIIFIMGFALFIAIVGALSSCSKQPDQFDNGERCYFACLLSDKYTGDSVFVVRDTLWVNRCLTKYWVDKEKEASLTADGMFRHCNPFIRNGQVVKLEIWTHVFDRNKITLPKIF